MKLKLVGKNERLIVDINKVVSRNEVFECPDEIGRKLLVQNIFEEIKDAKGDK